MVETRRRKQLGAWYTPAALVDEIVRRCVEPRGAREVSVVDPACGDGRFLVAAARAVVAGGGRPRLVGVDVDEAAVEQAAAALRPWGGVVHHADALARAWSSSDAGTFDVVVGNPPYLSQMAATTTRGRASSWGGGPYADAAVEFLALAAHLARPDGGRIGLVLPQSVLASRDAGEVRRRVGQVTCPRWMWWSPVPVFDAQVRTCSLVIETGRSTPVPRLEISKGMSFAPGEIAQGDDRSLHNAWWRGEWGRLLAHGLGVPTLPSLATAGTLGDRAVVHLDFRDEYYGLVGATFDGAHGPPLVTSGVIDPGLCTWGRRPVRFAKASHSAPRVALDRLNPQMLRWAESRLVPKVVVASQTRCIEAVVDADGAWLPGVPLLSVVPAGGDAVAGAWQIAAVLTSPVATAWVAARHAGTALSTTALRLSPSSLSALPWPSGDLSAAIAALAGHDVRSCGAAVCTAYGIDAGRAGELNSWWTGLLPRRAS